MNQAEDTYNFIHRPANMLRGNVTVQVTDLLRDAIVSLQLLPGTPIDKLAICARLDVSRHPVSEALGRLRSEGLVDIRPQRGSIVSFIRVDDVRQHMLVRRALESEAVKVLIDKYDQSDHDALQAAVARQIAAKEAGDEPLFHDLDREFHALLYAGARLERVREIIDQARGNIDRARRMIDSPRRLPDVIAEHQAIVAGITARDAQAASSAMRAHIDAATQEFFKFAESNPHMFDDSDKALI